MTNMLARIVLLLACIAAAVVAPWSVLLGFVAGVIAVTPFVAEFILVGIALDAFLAAPAGFFTASVVFFIVTGALLQRVFEQHNVLTVALSACIIAVGYALCFFALYPLWSGAGRVGGFFGAPLLRFFIGAAGGALLWRAAVARLSARDYLR